MLGDILGFMGKIPAGVWDILPTLGAPGWVGAIIKALVGLSGLTVLTRIIPDGWLYKPIVQFFDKAGLVCAAPLFLLGKGISESGRKVLGKKRWEKVETQVFERALMLLGRAILDGFSLFVQRIRNGVLDGLDADDPGVGKVG